MGPECTLSLSQEPIICPILNLTNPVYVSPFHLPKSHLMLSLPSISRSSKGSLSLRFHRFNPSCTSPDSHSRHIHRQFHSYWFDIPKFISWRVYFSKFLLMCLLHFPLTPSILSPNIFLSNLFSDTISPSSSLSAWDQVSYPYKTTGNTIFLSTLIIIFWYSKLEDRRFCTELEKTFPASNCIDLLIHHAMIIWSTASVFKKTNK